MSSALEREIKLRFEHVAAARAAVAAAGARPRRARRLQQDALLDTEDGLLRASRSALRVRSEDGQTVLTFKGPVRPATMKLREEVETAVADGSADVAAAARALGRAPSDYIVDSYRGLFARRCEELGVPFADMLFRGSHGSQDS